MGQLKDNGATSITTAAKVNTPGNNTVVNLFIDTADSNKIKAKMSDGSVRTGSVVAATLQFNP